MARVATVFHRQQAVTQGDRIDTLPQAVRCFEAVVDVLGRDLWIVTSVMLDFLVVQVEHPFHIAGTLLWHPLERFLIAANADVGLPAGLK